MNKIELINCKNLFKSFLVFSFIQIFCQWIYNAIFCKHRVVYICFVTSGPWSTYTITVVCDISLYICLR